MAIIFFLERLVAWTATFFPVLWTPFIYAWFCFFINVLASSYFVREGFSWIVESKKTRLVLCATFAIAAGTPEIHFNLCNLPTSLTWLSALILLEKPFKLSATKLAFLFLFIFSAGQFFLLLPLLVILFIHTRDKKYLVLILGTLFCFGLNLLATRSMAEQSSLVDYAQILKIPRAFIENFFLRLFVLPFWGPGLSNSLQKYFWIFWPLVMVEVYFFFRFFKLKKWTLKNEKLQILLALFVGTVGLYAMLVIARTYAHPYIFIQYGQAGWGLRYSFLPECAALLFWFFCFCGPTPETRRLWLSRFLKFH